MNQTQVNAMLQSLTNQLGNANVTIAQKDGELAVLREQLTALQHQAEAAAAAAAAAAETQPKES